MYNSTYGYNLKTFTEIIHISFDRSFSYRNSSIKKIVKFEPSANIING